MSSLRAALTALSALLLASACSTLPGPNEVYRGESATVELVPSGQAGNGLPHPARLDGSDLHQALAALRYTEPGVLGGTDDSAVFGPDELDELAPRLGAALAQARPDQRVAFVSVARGASATSGARKTEGSLFIDSSGRLNIAFAGIRHLMTVDDDFTRFRETSLGDPLRANRTLVRLSLEPQFIEARRQDNGERYPMWVTVDLARLGQTQAAHQRVERQDSRSQQRPSTPARIVDGEPTVSRTIPAPAENDTGRMAPEEVRERLAFLKSLHDEGLISDGEYEQQRQKILRRLD